MLCFAGSGYVDPDEHFDTVEPVAADVFDVKVSHGSVNSPSAQPIRYTLPYKRLLIKIKNPFC